VTFLALLSPVVATALGWIALGQRLTPLQALGVVLVLGSVTTAQLRPSPSTPFTSRARRPALPAPTNPEAITWAPPPQR
jgi:probable blue pigment (indigoidine) exporter